MFDNFDMGMPLGEKLVFALQVSLFGILMVFLLLIILAVLIMIISRVVRLGENLAGKKGKRMLLPMNPHPCSRALLPELLCPALSRRARSNLTALTSRPPRSSWL